ncbi:UNVERIFIED_CONTAM: WS/DGAT/MGAT family acyltransferase [Williamsia faeni]
MILTRKLLVVVATIEKMKRRSRPRTGIRVPSRDAMNIFLESDKADANLLQVVVVDSDAIDAPITLDTVRAWVSPRLESLPALRRRLHSVPGDVANPYWVDDEGFSLDQHITLTPVIEPGWAPLGRRLADLLTRRMDLAESTWELHIFTNVTGVDGFPERACVIALKVHHAMMDGVGLAHTARTLFGADTGKSSRGNTTEVAIAGGFAELVRFPRTIGKFVTELIRLRRHTFPAGPNATALPATRFNRPVDPDPVLQLIPFDLHRIQRMKAVVPGATVNDVMLTVVSIALTRYLSELGEPTSRLATTIPMDLRSAAGTDAANQVSTVTVDLHADIRDPLARLSAVHASADAAKAWARNLAASDHPRPMEIAPPAALKLVRIVSGLVPHTSSTVGSNTVISNVPMGDPDLEFLGARAVAAFSPMPIGDGVGLIHHVCSLGPVVMLSVSAERSMMDDSERYADLLTAAFTEMESATQEAGRSGRSLAS